MKAAFNTVYGSPEVVQIKELPTPVPKENDLLIRVHATTVNRTDCAILFGKPFIMRFFTGLAKPSTYIRGTDFAGVVESVGKNVTLFHPGDRVFGFDDTGLQSHAQYMTIADTKAISMIPEGLTYEQAAASVEGAHYAYNFITKVALHDGQRVLVNGATGAIGSAALQFLKYFGAVATAVCNTKNVALIRSLGADAVINYDTDDFTNDQQQYDFVFDAVGKSSFGKCKPLLKPNGVYISSELGPHGENLYLPLLTAFHRGKKVLFPFPVDIPRSLRFIRELLMRGAFTPVIDRTYPLEHIADAYRYVASGQKTGNVVITFE